MRNIKTVHAAVAAARQQGQDRQKEISGELAKVRAAVDDERSNAARLKAEVDELRKRAGRASELGERESQLKSQMTKFDARSKSLGEREAALAGSEARDGDSEGASAKASR